MSRAIAKTTPSLTDRARQAVDVELADLRFRSLLGGKEWLRLPEPIRERFSKRVSNGRAAIYAGSIEETRFSMLGRIIAQLARAIGAPLPTGRDSNVPAVVSVTEDFAAGGQIWTRIYARRRGFPQVIHSVKRFQGETGLEEHVGCGVGMSLTVHATADAIEFRSARYFVDVLAMRILIPRFLEPGRITVRHVELGNGRFRFTLLMEHPLFGMFIHQDALFSDAPNSQPPGPVPTVPRKERSAIT